MKQVTINLAFNSSTGDYTLSSTDTSIAQISADKKSYIVKGKIYTPVVSKTKNTLYRLNSWTMPSGSTVGTNSPSSSKSGSPNTTSDYTSSEVNYYTSHTTSPTYDYKTAEIACNSSTGSVSGDTDACSYSITYDTDTEYGDWKTDYSITLSAFYNGSTKTSNSMEKAAFSVSWSTAALVGPNGAKTYRITSASKKTWNMTDTKRYTPIGITASIENNATTSIRVYGTFNSQSRTEKTVYSNYRFSSVTWDSSRDGYTKYGSPSGGAGYTTASQRYRKQTSSGSTYYDPDFYSKFTFDASTGKITWSHRNGSTSYYNKVEDNSTFDIDDISTYTHNSTTWNADGLNIASSSKTSITLNISTIAWEWYKNGTLYASGDDIEVNGEMVSDFIVQ